MVSATTKLKLLLQLKKFAQIWAKRVTIPNWKKEKLIALALQRKLYKTKTAASKLSNVELANQLGIDIETGQERKAEKVKPGTEKSVEKPAKIKPEPTSAKKEEKTDISQLDLDKELSQKGGFRKMQALFKAAGLKPGTSKQTLINAYEKWKEKAEIKPQEEKKKTSSSTKETKEKTAEQVRKELEKIGQEYDESMKKTREERKELVEEAEKMFKAGKTGLKKYSLLDKKIKEIESTFAIIQKDLLEKGRELLYVNTPSKMYTFNGGTFDPDTDYMGFDELPDDSQMKAIEKGISIFKKMVGIPDVDQKMVSIIGVKKTASSFRSHYLTGQIGEIYFEGDDEAVIIHEAGHWLEDKSPRIHTKIKEFYERRTKGEETQKLSDVTETGSAYFDDNEVTKVDKFTNPYMGKLYPESHGNSEILSMGLEHMYRNPMAFAKNDPDYFDFIYNLMRGR